MDHLVKEAETFAQQYAKLFSSSHASSSEHVGDLVKEIGRYYRPGLTMFTNGKIQRFESQAAAAELIEREMRNNISTGLGTKLILQEIEKTETYSASSALLWIRWTFQPQAGSRYERQDWTFTNIYGYRAASAGEAAGWEFVVRDQEVNEVVRVTGGSFED